MHAFITHPIASFLFVGLAVVIAGFALKGLDDWFKARASVRRRLEA